MTADEYIFLKRSEVTIFTELDLLKTEIVGLHFAYLFSMKLNYESLLLCPFFISLQVIFCFLFAI